jgi:hypothetical protein
MDNTLENMQKMVESLRGLTENMLSKTLTPEVLQELTPQELDIIAEAKNALNFEGCSPSEKLNKLNALLRKNGL